MAKYRHLVQIEFPHGSMPSIKLPMQKENWLVLFATSNQTERGVFFYRRSLDGKWVHLETWGGVAAGDSAESIAVWPASVMPGFPEELARCFADEVVSGR